MKLLQTVFCLLVGFFHTFSEAKKAGSLGSLAVLTETIEKTIGTRSRTSFFEDAQSNVLLENAARAESEFTKKFPSTWKDVELCVSKSGKDSKLFQKCIYCCALKDFEKKDYFSDCRLYECPLNYALACWLKQNRSNHTSYATKKYLDSELNSTRWEPDFGWTCAASSEVTRSGSWRSDGVCPEKYPKTQ
uniref:Uncharacterized protein n=1 Tax=Chromera velia CCMP2878 TaxID=1169474 RepID=A0A0G4FYY3_9ALVE|eukprot:Cvel_3925.t1-p1 / transcript=Cvel_3925.t1 / gene=Cvel_3925 / organism=Chromera_velia_CCMP2878 / gene_product=hypothetical protein / transcript_product=hypothetical protein / location=Cvel_scaffold166:95614-96180(+) / protein_length=189 / sequence_SO=supercontig / SO=protein_coding / is_pseudo=false